MFSKLSKLPLWAIFSAAVVFLSLTLLCIGRLTDTPISGTGEYPTDATASANNTTEVAAPASPPETAPSTTAPSTTVTSTTVTSGTVTSGTEPTAAETQTTDPPLTTRQAQTTEPPFTTREALTTEALAGNGEETPKSLPGVLLGLTLLFGAAAGFSAALFIFRKQKKAILGPELQLSLAVFVFSALTDAYLYFLFKALLLAAGLFVLRETVSWVRARFPYTWTLAHRLGLFLSQGKAPAYIKIQAGVCVISSVAGVFLLRFTGADVIYPIVFALFFFLFSLSSLLCLIKTAGDLSHLTGQIDALQEGKAVEVSQGLFASSEETLSRTEETIQKAVGTALRDERFKVELISNVSHDLRTPLTSIIGYGELLKKENLSPEGAEQLELLNRKAQYLHALVDSLFELTKVSSGQLQPERKEIDIIKLLEQTLGLYDDALTDANLQVRRHYEKKTLPLYTDGNYLHRVFDNLVGNAVKYALPGMRVHLEVTETPEKCRVKITNVSAYELDFSPEEITRRFVRGDKARSSSGSGLGLAIAKTYTEALGGEFRIEISGDQFSASVTLPKENTERNL